MVITGRAGRILKRNCGWFFSFADERLRRHNCFVHRRKSVRGRHEQGPESSKPFDDQELKKIQVNIIRGSAADSANVRDVVNPQDIVIVRRTGIHWSQSHQKILNSYFTLYRLLEIYVQDWLPKRKFSFFYKFFLRCPFFFRVIKIHYFSNLLFKKKSIFLKLGFL